MNLNANDYLGKPVNICQGRDFQPWPSRSYITIEPLSFLHDRPWDDVALAYIHALRPSRVRVIRWNEGQQCDARVWRVTVQLKEGDVLVDSISQEVEVGLPESVPHGSGLKAALRHGIDSPQVAWHRIRGTTWVDGIAGTMSKLTDDGKEIPYPKS